MIAQLPLQPEKLPMRHRGGIMNIPPCFQPEGLPTSSRRCREALRANLRSVAEKLEPRSGSPIRLSRDGATTSRLRFHVIVSVGFTHGYSWATLRAGAQIANSTPLS